MGTCPGLTSVSVPGPSNMLISLDLQGQRGQHPDSIEQPSNMLRNGSREGGSNKDFNPLSATWSSTTLRTQSRGQGSDNIQ